MMLLETRHTAAADLYLSFLFAEQAAPSPLPRAAAVTAMVGWLGMLVEIRVITKAKGVRKNVRKKKEKDSGPEKGCLMVFGHPMCRVTGSAESRRGMTAPVFSRYECPRAVGGGVRLCLLPPNMVGVVMRVQQMDSDAFAERLNKPKLVATSSMSSSQAVANHIAQIHALPTLTYALR